MSLDARAHASAHGHAPVAIALIGFMAAGKSTVGRALAQRLRWSFLDLDEEIERRAGIRIAEWFQTRGESAFRAMESRLTDELSCLRRAVLATGGGWVMMDDAFERLPPGTRVVWLRISAGEAVRRAQAAGSDRPLLAGPDPLADAERLLDRRERFYARADVTIDVEGRSVHDIVERIVWSLGLEGDANQHHG